MIFDTHAHYDDKAFDADRTQMLASLAEAGIGRVVDVGSTIESNAQVLALALDVLDPVAAHLRRLPHEVPVIIRDPQALGQGGGQGPSQGPVLPADRDDRAFFQ